MTDRLASEAALAARLESVYRERLMAEGLASARPAVGPQLRITYGDYALRPETIQPLHASWCYVLPLANLLRARVEAGDTQAEIESYLLHTHSRYSSGWRSCLESDEDQCWLTSLHVSHLWPIRQTEYELARAHGFRSSEINNQLWVRAMRTRLRAQIAASRSRVEQDGSSQ